MKLYLGKTKTLNVDSCGTYSKGYGSGCVSGDEDHVTLTLRVENEYFDIVFTENSEVEGMIAVLQRIKGQLNSPAHRTDFHHQSHPVKV